MKRRMIMVLWFAAMAAIVGCSDAQESAGSYGIIGGNDGTAADMV